ncbi:MAG: metalloregulator ArsR/SmtB family transcription factor [Hyphomicrobiales bacterium]|nr:metalloregulator ArsR/SmtB family transcription factor [Hyphomicrobiales bacterium]
MPLRSADAMVAGLKAAADPTRLRILALLATGEHNVKDLTRILGQSQPRISRHLKLLTEAGLVGRAQEGSWAFFHLAEAASGGGLARRLLAELDLNDAQLARDRHRADAIRSEHETQAQSYFETEAANWDTIRTLYVEEAEVEAAVRNALVDRSIDLLVDLGTGTGRMLQLLADEYRQALGLDINRAMLAYARAKLERSGIMHAQVRQGDVYNIPLGDGAASAVVIHQILHFLADPARAITEAARILAPGGRLVIVDFASHQLEMLRERHAHVRLGFEDQQMRTWLASAGLDVAPTRHLEPAGTHDTERLVVSVWIADAPVSAKSPSPTKSPALERVR